MCSDSCPRVLREIIHPSISECLALTDLTHRNNPPMLQPKSSVTHLQTQETKHRKELREGGTAKENDPSRDVMLTFSPLVSIKADQP